ncbi:MAG: isochorismatase [Colwellia sp.]|nr:isochorismatase [Colwellia sp.]
MLTNDSNDTLLQAVKLASDKWQSAFNRGDYAECSEQYENNAEMNVEPFGQYIGKEAIKVFWKKLVEDGFSDVEYLKPDIKVIDETSAMLTSGWKMNKAAGTISKELWVLQKDGSAKLRVDNFEVNS